VSLNLHRYSINYRGLEYPASKYVLLVNHFWLHRNPKSWGPDADKFDPERFAEGKEIPLAYQPFSKGIFLRPPELMIVPRTCIGQEFAYLEARVVVSLVLRKFTFISMYPGTPYQVRAFTAKPVGGMPMQVVMAS
jgi:cytochrome P450